MDHKRFGKLVREKREQRGITAIELSLQLKITASRLSQIEKGEEQLRDIESVYRHIEKIASYLQKIPLKDTNRQESAMLIEKELTNALFQDEMLDNKDVNKTLIRIINYFKTKREYPFSTGYEEMVEYIKKNLPEYFQDPISIPNLNEILGVYNFYEFSSSEKHLITKRHLWIKIDPETKGLQVIKTCPSTMNLFSYKERIGTIRRKDDILYIDLAEKGGIEKLRIVCLIPVEVPQYLTGISLDLTPNKEPMARCVVLEKRSDLSRESEADFITRKEKENVQVYNEHLFSQEFPEIYSVLTSSKNNKLTTKRFSSYLNIYGHEQKKRNYISFAYSTTEPNKISTNVLEITEIGAEEKFYITFPDNLSIQGTIIRESGRAIVIQGYDMLIAINKMPRLQIKIEKEHNVLTGIQTFFSDSRKVSIRANKVLFLRLKSPKSIDTEAIKSEKEKRIEFLKENLGRKVIDKDSVDIEEESLYSYISSIYDDIYSTNNLSKDKNSADDIANAILSFLTLDTKENVIHSYNDFQEWDIFKINKAKKYKKKE